MGICFSHNEVETHMKRSRHNAKIDTVNKLLLLGAGASGKSTLFRQIEYCYGSGFKPEDREAYKAIIHSHLITSTKVLCKNCVEFGREVQENVLEAKKSILELGHGAVVDQTVAMHIKKLWADPGIQLAYRNREQFQIFDNVDYFMERVDELAASNYQPPNDHIFRARVRTTGIVEMKFEIEENQFKMFDVGGQRNERRKWVHCFDHVTAVIFVAALSAYNEKLYEDRKTARVIEALTLFSEVCKSKWFIKTSKILFLNKKDLFAKKIPDYPLVDYFPDYKGDTKDVEASEAFLRNLFEECGEKGVRIYTHTTTATDTAQIKLVFSAVRDIVIRKSLNESGLSAEC